MQTWIIPVIAILGLLVAFCLASYVSKSDAGNERMQEISGFIREGAFAFLTSEYKVLLLSLHFS